MKSFDKSDDLVKETPSILSYPIDDLPVFSRSKVAVHLPRFTRFCIGLDEPATEK